ncbi:hypothetical protein BLOT_016298, partial [Blomia tropicalis]
NKSILMSNRSRKRGNQNNESISTGGDDIHLLSEKSKQEYGTNLRGDYLNITILLFLYILQGIPLGLIGSVPLILSNRGVTYAQQAIFSFVIWPFSVKLLWAPIVDSLYWEKFGRRKSWLVPVQYLIGFFMIFISYTVESLLNNSAGPSMTLLTIMFLFLNFLAATQDVAVDGWALTMLKPHNVGYASTCNSVGQTAGYFLGNVVFLTLESAEFANSYIRSVPQPNGLIDLPGFFFFWGIVFIVATTLVMIFKHESIEKHSKSEMTIKQTYYKLIGISRLPSIRRFILILMTCKIGFAVTDAATGLKLVEAGVHKENLALLAIPLVPLQILLPWFISRYTNGPKPLDIFIKAYPYRLYLGIVFAGILWWTRYLHQTIGTFPSYYYAIIVLIYAAHQVTLYSMFVAITSFHAKISDPTIGGTYMTFLNTICNLGGNWPATVSLWFIDKLTYRSCSRNSSSCTVDSEECGKCEISLDGYYLEACFCILFGTIWYIWGRRQLSQLQSKSPKAWRIGKSS